MGMFPRHWLSNAAQVRGLSQIDVKLSIRVEFWFSIRYRLRPANPLEIAA
jgi:hypothetical protein